MTDEIVPIILRLSKDLIAELSRLAKEDNRPRNNLISHILHNWVKSKKEDVNWQGRD